MLNDFHVTKTSLFFSNAKKSVYSAVMSTFK